jgi:DAK2 domain fusion protein YloV
MLKKAVISASNNLSNQKQSVDDMNVFPVPDGDTGTNMSMTISAAARELLPLDDGKDVSEIADCVASASLRGARGNSGVILSQLFRGFAKSVSGKARIGTADFAAAMKAASDTAYKAVMKPTEGTILTVAREAAEYAVTLAEETEEILPFFEGTLRKAKETLDQTPELLPVLKRAGVVDAGGMGLVVILEGVVAALRGEEIASLRPDGAEAVQRAVPSVDAEHIKFIYCTEFIITKKSLNYSMQAFRAAIERVGDSMLVIEDGEIVKVHIHTNRPGYVLEQAVKIGELSSLKIDNMKIQHNAGATDGAAAETSPPKQYGIVAVASGDGLEQIFTDIGADGIVRGGQSMNPSTEDILQAVSGVNAETVFVLPNNKNIILAAEQAAAISGKNTVVLPSKTIPQGISAVLMFDENADVAANTENMTEAIAAIKTGQVTFAARDSEVDGKAVKAGDVMGMEESKITVLGDAPNAVAMRVTENLADDASTVISFFYGNGVAERDAQALADDIKQKYPACDVILHQGGQPLYYYIISVE